MNLTQSSRQRKGAPIHATEDLRETISLMRRREYEVAIRRASGPQDLGAIENQMRTDSRLTHHDRIQLLSDLAGAA